MRRNGKSLRYTFSFSKKEEGEYRYLKFKVNRGVKGIYINYEYSDEECTIDIGIFAPGNLDLTKANFRGWSGSNKRRIFISEKGSTPGYLDGPIEEGTWNIILGLYKIPEDGCKTCIDITLLRETSVPSFSSFSERRTTHRRPSQKAGWLKGDLHVHTVHSDGDSDIYEIVNWARHLSLDFIGITDHNTISHLNKVKSKELVVVPGEEVTTYKGHMNVLGINKWIDFRIKSKEDLLKVLSYINKEGFLPIVNHPKSLGPKWEWGYIEKIGFIEVWQGIWEFNNHESLRLWDELLSKGSHIIAVGGSDVHRFKTLDFVFKLSVPTTWIYAKRSNVAGILKGIKEGKVIITEGASGPFLNYCLVNRGGHFHMGDRLNPGKYKLIIYTNKGKNLKLRAVTARGVVHVVDVTESSATSSVYMDLSEEDKFLRLELVTPSLNIYEPYDEEVVVRALTNPVFIRSLS